MHPATGARGRGRQEPARGATKPAPEEVGAFSATDEAEAEFLRGQVGDVPVLWCMPAAPAEHLAIWLPGLGGDRQGLRPQLRDLAAAGFVAVGCDPADHGARALEPREAMVARVVGNKRRYFWPILAQTAQDVSAVIDWAQAQLGVHGSAVIGGVSMGGDIAVAAAGRDRRIVAVAAAISTPDWMRPGTVEPQGEPDAVAQACYAEWDPATHPERYAHIPALGFFNGRDDILVPPEGARRFVAALLRGPYADVPERVQLSEFAVGHRFTPEMWDAARTWLVRWGLP